MRLGELDKWFWKGGEFEGESLKAVAGGVENRRMVKGLRKECVEHRSRE